MAGSPHVVILRLGHRPARDKRVTTHVCLTARAFGADGVLVSTRDRTLERTVRAVVDKFGGAFFIETGVAWRRVIREWKGTVVHLTMYGEPVDDVLPHLARDALLLVVGAEKVPSELFEVAHVNVAIGNQPHSEVAALAVFLDRLFAGSAVRREFGGSVRVVPSARGKRMRKG